MHVHHLGWSNVLCHRKRTYFMWAELTVMSGEVVWSIEDSSRYLGSLLTMVNVIAYICFFGLLTDYARVWTFLHYLTKYRPSYSYKF